MAPAVHRFQVETTLASNPRFVLQNLVAVLGVLEIVVGVFFSQSRQHHDAVWGGERGCVISSWVEDAPN